MEKLRTWIRRAPFLVYGMPLVILTVTGAFGLAHVQQGRTDVLKAREDRDWEILKRTKALNREGHVNIPTQLPRKRIDLEEELKELQQKLDINSFEYKQIPKLGEKVGQGK